MKFCLALLAMLSTVAGLGACRDPIELQATEPVFTDTLTVYALSGTPPGYPNALSLPARQLVSVSGFGGFDIAFDLDDSNRVLILPARRVVTFGQLVPQVGLQIVPGTFESVTAAPTSGYKVDSTLVASEGDVIVLEAAHNAEGDLCSFALSPNLYAKVSIDTVFVATRTIKFRFVYDPNCGYRSFAPGIPTD
ncbi:MAG TPA: hypothetical protein VJZ25_08085 [Gemmatimonadaceae bacterium]|nr:hypothetical protein [Gemmatimonadaceae bacterium]